MSICQASRERPRRKLIESQGVLNTMYPNLPDATLQDVMRNILEYTFEYQNQHGLFSIEIFRGCVDSHTDPVGRQAFLSSKQPQPVTVNSKNHVWVGPAKIFQSLKFVLDEEFVQFGPHIYRQTSIWCFHGDLRGP